VPPAEASVSAGGFQPSKGNAMLYQEIAYLSVWPVTASIIFREANGRSWYSIEFRRRYKDLQGTWRTIDSFVPDDLPALIKIAQQAHDELTIIQEADRYHETNRAKQSSLPDDTLCDAIR
jgi:hypothetical protein